ncbi:MAG: hypothetical protein V9G08_02180 [Dermatophilaceae bacterium]
MSSRFGVEDHRNEGFSQLPNRIPIGLWEAQDLEESSARDAVITEGLERVHVGGSRAVDFGAPVGTGSVAGRARRQGREAPWTRPGDRRMLGGGSAAESLRFWSTLE